MSHLLSLLKLTDYKVDDDVNLQGNGIYNSGFLRGGDIFTRGFIGQEDTQLVPRVTAQNSNFRTTQDISIKDGIAYLMDDDTVRRIDVSDPQRPRELENGSFTPVSKDIFSGIQEYKGNLYIVDESSDDLLVYDVHNLTSETQLGSLNDRALSNWTDFTVQDDILFTCATGDVSSGELIIIDISDPANPSILSRVSGASRVVVDGDYAYTTQSTYDGVGTTYFRIWDISDLSNPNQLSETQKGSWDDLVKFGNRVFVSYLSSFDNSSIYEYDVSDKTSPTQLSSTSVGVTNITYLVNRGKYIYGIDGGNLYIWDILPSGVTQVASVSAPTDSDSTPIYLYGDNLFTTDGGSNLIIFGSPKKYDSGTATLLSGNTSVTVNIGVDFVPTAQDININPLTPPEGYGEYYLQNVRSGSFDISVATAPSRDVDFAWEVDVR